MLLTGPSRMETHLINMVCSRYTNSIFHYINCQVQINRNLRSETALQPPPFITILKPLPKPSLPIPSPLPIFDINANTTPFIIAVFTNTHLHINAGSRKAWNLMFN